MSGVAFLLGAIPVAVLLRAAHVHRMGRARAVEPVPTPGERLARYAALLGDPKDDPDLTARQLAGYRVIRSLLVRYPEYRYKRAGRLYALPRRPRPVLPRAGSRKAVRGH